MKKMAKQSAQLSLLICVLFAACFLLVSPRALAQRRGGGRGAAGRTVPGTAGDPESPEAKQLERAAIIQARPEQVVQFQAMTNSNQAVRSNAEKLIQNASTAGKIDLFHYTKSISDAVDDAQSQNTQFLQSFSNAQKNGMKNFIKKLGKESSELAKDEKALNRELERSKVSGTHLAEIAKRLETALAGFQAQQFAIGSEMGIPGSRRSL